MAAVELGVPLEQSEDLLPLLSNREKRLGSSAALNAKFDQNHIRCQVFGRWGS
jgi:hypothetical protein